MNSQQEEYAARMAENAARHREEHTNIESWLNESKIREYLTNYHDATPVELIDVLDMLRTSIIFSTEDRESGSAPLTALAMIRGGTL
jgi:hypothetical protein